MSHVRAGLKALVAKSLHRGLVTIGAGGVLVLLVAVVPASSASAAASATVRNTVRGTLLASLTDPAATSDDNFGFRSAVAANTVVVGAPGTSSAEGAAYIYEKGASGWPTTPTVTLTDPAATSDDDFGFSVAVAVTGTTVIVGAPGTTDVGTAYIYVKGASGWPSTPTATLTDPAATSGDDFGFSVAVSRLSAMTAVIGAPGTSTNAGAAYIYVNGASGWPTTPTATLSDPAATSQDIFGFSVAISGKNAVVGAPFNFSTAEGTTYIYVNGASGWPTTPTATLSDPAATADDHFGYSVGVGNGTVVVGDPGTSSNTGTAYFYVKSASAWPTTPTTTLSDPEATAGDVFGYSVSVSEGTAIVGDPGTSSNTGTAYFYVKSASAWPTTPTTALTDPAATAGDEFGYSVGVFQKTAVVGAPITNSYGAAYIYKA